MNRAVSKTLGCIEHATGVIEKMRDIPNTEDRAANAHQVTAERHMCLLEWGECSSTC